MKVGIISYINSIPLGHNLKGEFEVVKDTPHRLAERFYNGELDASFIPSAAYLQNGAKGVVMPGVSISSIGATNSVFLSFNKSVDQIKKVKLSVESRTSNCIARIILEQQYNLTPVFNHDFEDEDARVVIGDKALKIADEENLLDLGIEWLKYTNLPVVYALCVCRNEDVMERLGDLIVRQYDANMADIENIMKSYGHDRHIEYVRTLNYRLDESHLKSLDLMRKLIGVCA